MTSPFSSGDISPLGGFQHISDSALLHSAATKPLLHKISISLCPLNVIAFELGAVCLCKNPPILSALNTDCAGMSKESSVSAHAVLHVSLLPVFSL